MQPRSTPACTRTPFSPEKPPKASPACCTHGFQLVAEPISFLVDRHNHLLVGEEERAERWGANLATKLPLSHEH